ncbi:hypothetical protein LJ655_12305 [Paraburkholderia sp. MMS20-SJTN17]|uniref:Uncharacterized protein n=1 Tax=Paraburkholderia translucens TaxID=2886945 RepID=A0ABS8KD45_9BURK|nr:hypothetical protein [Paraburkholderia sp. MMS20-SJTN17]MCC8402664.1 hypothetical protein [Paraburkholderia sp. MMS20-SJTN17]
MRRLIARGCNGGAHVVHELEPVIVCALIDAVNELEGNLKQPTNTEI